jgi:hypothetical protein
LDIYGGYKDAQRKEVLVGAAGSGFGTLATLWWRSWLFRAANLRLWFVDGAAVAWPMAVARSIASSVEVVLPAMVMWWPICHTTVVWLVVLVVSCVKGTIQVKIHPFLGRRWCAFGVMSFLKGDVELPQRGS